MSSNEPFIYRIKPLYYIHVLDTRTSCTRLVTGPLTFTRQDNESVVFGPEQMVIIPPRHYAVIANPVVRDKKGQPTLDKNGNFKIHHGADEMRWEQEPFPLYPGEKLNGAVTPLSKWVIAADSALRLRAYRDFIDGKEKRVAGQEWLFLGPGTYTPRVDVGVVSTGKAYIVKPQTALRLRAWQECVDVYGQKRKVGEEWLVREPGAYLPRVYEEFVAVVNGHVLTEHTALHLRATRTAVDVFGKKRKAGEEWLVTVRDAESYVCDVNEELVATTRLTTLTSLQYCVVLDPYDEASGAHRLGQKEVRRGICSFFLRPGERLEAGIQAVHVLSEDEALLIRAREATTVKGVKYAPGDRWLEHGPTDYVPPVQVEILERRKAVPLDVNEGIYVRDVGTGKVRLVTGQSYLLAANEELWAKEVPKAVEELLVAHGAAPRGKSDMVSVRMPHNTVMQVYDYKEKRQRVVWGPELVMLGPDEQFSVLSLSGETPKRPHVVKALWLDLGPDFMSDVVTVETTDHARLSLRLSYTWHFDVRPGESGQGGIFQVPDFIGDACKAIASKIRAAVALSSFDAFHKNFARIIRTAVFGADAASGRAGQRLFFEANRLAITNVDIESVEPIDQRTRDSLQKSVQLAIEITTKSQEAVAKHEAERLEQEARATLERERLGLDSEVEKSRKGLKEQQALNSAVESSGHATAEAKARAAALEIEGQSSVKVAQMRAEASMISATAGLAQKEAQQEAEVAHLSACNNLEISKKEELSQIEAGKFKSIVDAIGSGTIAAIARAGPEMQAKLLHGLGLKSLLVSDGHTPVNLFSAAGGLIAQGADAKAADAKAADKKKEAAPAPVKEAN